MIITTRMRATLREAAYAHQFSFQPEAWVRGRRRHLEALFRRGLVDACRIGTNPAARVHYFLNDAGHDVAEGLDQR